MCPPMAVDKPGLEVSGHRLFAVISALTLIVDTSPVGSHERGEALAHLTEVKRFYDQYAQTVYIRFKGRQMSLRKAGEQYLAWRAKREETTCFKEHYELLTLGTQLHEGHIIKMRLDGLDEDVLTFQGKLPDLINGNW